MGFFDWLLDRPWHTLCLGTGLVIFVLAVYILQSHFAYADAGILILGLALIAFSIYRLRERLREFPSQNKALFRLSYVVAASLVLVILFSSIFLFSLTSGKLANLDPEDFLYQFLISLLTVLVTFPTTILVLSLINRSQSLANPLKDLIRFIRRKQMR